MANANKFFNSQALGGKGSQHDQYGNYCIDYPDHIAWECIMPYITREDGEHFVIPSYRDVLTV